MGARGKIALFAVIFSWAGLCGIASAEVKLTAKQALGKQLFFDTKLSRPNGQSCATCHSPEVAFTDPDKSKPVSNGVILTLFGFRNAPTVPYSSFSPPFHYDDEGGTYVGGLFWDGRADDLTEQAEAPFLNQVEMHNHNKAQVIEDLANSSLADQFKKIYGKNALDTKNIEKAYAQVANAIAAYEGSREVNQFSSKFDYYLQGKVKLTKREAFGLELFNGKANCNACHPSTIIGDEPAPLFTDFTYDNIGIPKNWQNPFLYLNAKYNPAKKKFIDVGLANTVALDDPIGAEAEAGKFKVSTLRNLELTAPYGHNGYFKTMKQIVHFYNTRDVPEAGWEPGEVPQTVNHEELGNLGLTDDEENAVVTFLRTLTDGYQMPSSSK